MGSAGVQSPSHTIEFKGVLFNSAQTGTILFFRRRRGIVEDHVEQSGVNLQIAVVLEEAELAELVHEGAHARPRRADCLREPDGGLRTVPAGSGHGVMRVPA
jgi:hypothetical protein